MLTAVSRRLQMLNFSFRKLVKKKSTTTTKNFLFLQPDDNLWNQTQYLSLKPKNCSGLYGFPAKLLKVLPEPVLKTFAHIFNHSFVTGKFTKALKKDKVIPIYKKGNPYFYKSTDRSVLVLFLKPWIRVSTSILIAAKFYQNSSSVSVPIILRLLLVIALLIKSLSILEIVKLHQPFFF